MRRSWWPALIPALQRLEELQLGWREGAAIDVLADNAPQLSGDVAAGRRWPRWGPATAGAGWRSVLSVPLVLPHHPTAALSLYAWSAGAFDITYTDAARIFALYATTVVAQAVQALELDEAVQARHRIGLAQGILMAYHGVAADAAFSLLRQHSQHFNIKLRTVAQHVITTGALSTPQLAPDPYSASADRCSSLPAPQAFRTCCPDSP